MVSPMEKTKPKKSNYRALFNAILQLRGPDDCENFLRDLCTPGELDAMADRWEVARLLEKGVPYREIYDRTGVSTATVTRVAKSLSNGQGGYLQIIERIKTSER